LSCLFSAHYVLLLQSLLHISSPFLFILPHPPSSTLFPYTTLFRSSPSCRRSQSNCGPCNDASTARVKDLRGQNGGALARHHFALDRKSTRLNSSHQIISYAVFCLKKKKKNKKTQKQKQTNREYEHT